MWQIFFYEDHRGKSPVLDFMNALSARDRAKVNNALRLLEEFGTDLGDAPRAPDQRPAVGIAPR